MKCDTHTPGALSIFRCSKLFCGIFFKTIITTGMNLYFNCLKKSIQQKFVQFGYK